MHLKSTQIDSGRGVSGSTEYGSIPDSQEYSARDSVYVLPGGAGSLMNAAGC